MDRDNTWRWEFLGFQSEAEGRPVQDWFDALPEEPDRYEITDLLDRLRITNDRRWLKEVFDPLKGAGGISEIKIPNIRRYRDSRYQIITYRIYGWFGPHEHCYTFLHGAGKDVKNDRLGKQIAKRRLEELQRGSAGVHKFKFEEGPDSEAQEEPGRTN